MSIENDIKALSIAPPWVKVVDKSPQLFLEETEKGLNELETILRGGEKTMNGVEIFKAFVNGLQVVQWVAVTAELEKIKATLYRARMMAEK